MRNCQHCSQAFRPKRLAQIYCSTPCRKADFKRRTGSQGSAREASPATTLSPALAPAAPLPEAASGGDYTPPYFNPHGPTPGALQGDDY
jgi:hypothetical protein